MSGTFKGRTPEESVRALSRLLDLGLERFVEAQPELPYFYDLQTLRRKYMGDNPDQTYRRANIRDDAHYLVRGSLDGGVGTEISLYAGSFANNANTERRMLGTLTEHDISVDNDGNWELYLLPEGATPQRECANQLRLSGGASSLLIRTYFPDRERRLAHALPKIDVVSMPSSASLRSTLAYSSALKNVAPFLEGTLDTFRGYWKGISHNQLYAMEDAGDLHTPGSVRYVLANLNLEPHQSFRVTFKPGQNASNYWNFVIQDYLGETPDWKIHPVVLNRSDVVTDADGNITIYVSNTDRGKGNWLSMAGRTRMILSFRWRGGTPVPPLEGVVV